MSHSAKAVGIRILVKPDPVMKETESGIQLALDERLERGAQVSGVVLDIGEEAFRSFNRAAGFEQYRPWCKVGDHIYYPKYAGKGIRDKATLEDLLYINDEDVVGLVE